MGTKGIASRKASRISRRQFVAGASAAAAAGFVANSIVAHAEAAEATDAGDSNSTTQAASTTMDSGFEENTPIDMGGGWSNPNTQTDEAIYGTNERELTQLFSPITIAGHELRNRICKSGAGCPGTFNDDGTPSEALLRYYESIARGGAGYVILDTNTAPVEGLRQVADRVHAQGALIGMQHYSMSNWMPGGFSSSSSVVTTGSLDFGQAGPVMATVEDIKGIEEEFIQRGVDAYEAGFDGFDINAGCNHLLDAFLSRVFNNERTDEYGPQSLENRARIVTEIIEGIRERVGEDFIISVLFNAFEVDVYDQANQDGCTTLEEGIGFAKLFEAAGASMLHVRWGAHGNHAAAFFPDRLYVCEPGATGYSGLVDFTKGAMGDWEYRYEGAFAAAPIARHIKEAVTIPVATVGCMDPRLAPDLAEEALERGDIDLLMMTRPLMADPEMPNKLQQGRRDEIAPCTHCETCFMSNDGCRVNPAFGREGTDEMPESYGEWPQAAEPKHVMVIGGGPAGMEAARVAAYCGHTVRLYEKASELGGKLDFAALVKGTHELIADYKDYLVRQLEVAGVDVVTDTEVTAETVSSEAPDVVVLASGATYAAPDWAPGIDTSAIAYSLEGGLACSDQSVVVLGYDVQALNMAEYLVKRGNRVTVVNPVGGYTAVNPAAMAGDASAGANPEEAAAAMAGATPDRVAEATPDAAAAETAGDASTASATPEATETAGDASTATTPDATAGANPDAAAMAGAASPSLGANMASYVVEPTLNWLCKRGVKIYSNATVNEVGDASVRITSEWGIDYEIPADIVLYANQAPATELAEQLSGLVSEFVCVGDANEPANIVFGVRDAHLAARAL